MYLKSRWLSSYSCGSILFLSLRGSNWSQKTWQVSSPDISSGPAIGLVSNSEWIRATLSNRCCPHSSTHLCRCSSSPLYPRGHAYPTLKKVVRCQSVDAIRVENALIDGHPYRHNIGLSSSLSNVQSSPLLSFSSTLDVSSLFSSP